MDKHDERRAVRRQVQVDRLPRPSELQRVHVECVLQLARVESGYHGGGS